MGFCSAFDVSPACAKQARQLPRQWQQPQLAQQPQPFWATPARQGLRLLRAAPAPAVPAPPAPALTRYSTVGPGVNPPYIESESPVPGLSKFLKALGLEAYALSAKRWAQEQGACNLSELVENADELSAALGLPASKRAQLQGSHHLARQLEQELRGHHLPSAASTALTASMAPRRLVKALSVPVTIAAPARAQRAVPSAPFAGPASIPVRDMERTETDVWDEKEAAAHGSIGTAADVQEPAIRRVPEPPRYCTPPKTRWRVDDALLRRRIPSEAEVKVKALAVADAEAEAREAWEDTEDTTDPKSKHPKPNLNESRFEAMRGQFLEDHGPTLQQELGTGYKLVPADVAPKIQEKFLQECNAHGSPDFGYHGTRAANIPSILSQGLRVPSAASGVRVENGSAHGVGIYTAMPGNYWLSRGFADTKNMLVCGVVDPDADPRPRLAQNVTAAAAPPRRTGGHRNHHTPVVTQPANLVPAPNYQVWTHRESDGIKVVGGARVIFKEERVAPLFVAQPIDSDQTFSRSAANHKEASRAGRKGQVYIPQSGEVVWDCWEEVRDWNARRVKRMVVTKERQQQRAAARQVKQEAQEPPQ